MAPPTQPWRHEIDRIDDRVTGVHDTIQTHLPRIASLEYRCADMTKKIDYHATNLVDAKAVALKVSQLESKLDKALLRRQNKEEAMPQAMGHRGPGDPAPAAPAPAPSASSPGSPMMFDFEAIEEQENQVVTADLGKDAERQLPPPVPARQEAQENEHRRDEQKHHDVPEQNEHDDAVPMPSDQSDFYLLLDRLNDLSYDVENAVQISQRAELLVENLQVQIKSTALQDPATSIARLNYLEQQVKLQQSLSISSSSFFLPNVLCSVCRCTS